MDMDEMTDEEIENLSKPYPLFVPEYPDATLPTNEDLLFPGGPVHLTSAGSEFAAADMVQRLYWSHRLPPSSTVLSPTISTAYYVTPLVLGDPTFDEASQLWLGSSHGFSLYTCFRSLIKVCKDLSRLGSHFGKTSRRSFFTETFQHGFPSW